jgi:energy-coupling factor transporter ATP-binding protein EcfA2
MLASLEVENKRYGLLSKGNRQKARIVFAEVVSRARNVNFLGMDEPFSGLDFPAREYLVGRWMENADQERHLLSMHPSEIAVEPSQILLVSRGEIWTVPSSTPWPKIRASCRNLNQRLSGSVGALPYQYKPTGISLPQPYEIDPSSPFEAGHARS